MTLLSSILGWAVFGVVARGYANALDRIHPLKGARGHAAAAIIFGSFGYWIFGVQQSYRDQLHKKLMIVHERKRQEEAMKQNLSQSQ